MSPKASENWIKKTALRWIWRVQQIGAVSTLVITAITLTLTVSNKIEWRFENPYMSVILTFILLASVIASLGYAWDKGRMWHEQNVVNVERNPYNIKKMTPKEIVGYTELWFPKIRAIKGIAEKLGLEKEAKDLDQVLREFEPWCEEQLKGDSVLAEQTRTLQEYLKEKAKG
jgi:hypothetical protein